MTDLPPAPHIFLPPFDSAPLACVLQQVDAALQRSASLLFDASRREQHQRAQPLQDAGLQLQLAGSALRLANVEGAALLTQAGGVALQRFSDGTLACSAEHVQTVVDLLQALSDYLDQVLSGAPAQPVRLFPYYGALQAMLGSARIHPADLFFPDLTLGVAIAPADQLIAADYPAWRQRFEQSLLPFLTDGALAAQHAGALRDVVAQVAQAQTEAPARTFWCALQGVAELVASGQLASSRYVKQLFGLINLQIRRQSQGAGELPEAMLRDALFFLALHATAAHAAAPGASVLQQLLQGYRLGGMVPLEFELRRYDRLAPERAPSDSGTRDIVMQDVAARVPVAGNVIGFPLMAAGATAPAESEPMKQIGRMNISLAAHGSYLSSTDVTLRLLARDFDEWRHEPQRAASGAAMLALRTLAETSAAIGFHSMRQLAQALEMALRGLRACAAPALALEPAQRDVLERVLQRSRGMLNDFALGDMPAAQGPLVVALQQLRAQLQPMQQPRPPGLQFDQPLADKCRVDAPLSQPQAGQDAGVALPALDPVARVALVRVRADILARMATQAGAVALSRARLEEDVVTLRSALGDFSENLFRLRRQLRDVGMQAEAQIASRMAIAKAIEFDALEFDRCARLQELTRMMADSVDAVAGVHRRLMAGVETASGNLQQQAGWTRALQNDVRLVRTLSTDGSVLSPARARVRLRRPQSGAAFPGVLTIA